MKISREARRTARGLLQLSLVNGHVDAARTAEISSKVVSEKPRGYVQILKEFTRLVRLELDKRRAVVESALALDAAESSRLETSIKQKFGSDVSVEFRTTPDLLGGVRIQLGSDVWDGSISARLAALQKTI
ncbi:MAG TPA: F0F1 ATP synthase subunit delta [Terrimicrobiaceae bacterium]|nr:F0F1 ATP synthase subunit delta [Terrimicrobiaceae bacterium]